MADNRSPILNNPYEEPILHYDADPNGNRDYTKILKGGRAYSAHMEVAPNRPDGALFGFSFEDSINDADYNLRTYTFSKVRMHDDLMQDGRLKKDKGAGSFITIGEPDIQIVNHNEYSCHVEIRDLDIYDPIKDDVKARSTTDIAYWEIYDDYNEEQFIVREVHFCGRSKNEFETWRKGINGIASTKTKKKAETTLKLELNDEVWETLYDFRNSTIERTPGRKVCIRVITQFGEESSNILTIE